MADDEFSALKRMALHRGYKLVRSRKRTAGVGDFGKYALTDEKGAKLLGFGAAGFTASAAEIEDYLQSGRTSIWQQSVKITPKRKKRPARAQSNSARPDSPLPPRAKDERQEQAEVPKEIPLIIRPVRAGDAQALCELVGNGAKTAATASDIEQAMKSFQSKSCGIAVAELESVIGVVGWSVIPTLNQGAIGRISLLSVAPTHRGEELEGKLLLSAEIALQDLGCTQFEVASDFDTGSDNRLLRKQKYRQSGYRFVREAR